MPGRSVAYLPGREREVCQHVIPVLLAGTGLLSPSKKSLGDAYVPTCPPCFRSSRLVSSSPPMLDDCYYSGELEDPIKKHSISIGWLGEETLTMMIALSTTMAAPKSAYSTYMRGVYYSYLGLLTIHFRISGGFVVLLTVSDRPDDSDPGPRHRPPA